MSREKTLELLKLVAPLFLTGALAYLTVQADARYVAKDIYDRDQTRHEKRLERIEDKIDRILERR